jgi:hypothetical protein
LLLLSRSVAGLIPCRTWRADPDSEIISFAKRTAKDLKLPANFVPQMLQSIQVPLFFLLLACLVLQNATLLLLLTILSIVLLQTGATCGVPLLRGAGDADQGEDCASQGLVCFSV